MRVAPNLDIVAPDGSEIRLLPQVGGASMVHCTLQPGRTTQAVQHRTVEELWYCLGGTGELWRADAHGHQEVIRLEPGVAVNIPLGVRFQFRTLSSQALELVIATAPPWPGPDETIALPGCWNT